jgi:hypothetical protein
MPTYRNGEVLVSGKLHPFFPLVLTILTIYCIFTYENIIFYFVSIKLSQNFSCITSYKKLLREVKKIMKINLINSNGKKQCTLLNVYLTNFG